jgi:hypothetical protein
MKGRLLQAEYKFVYGASNVISLIATMYNAVFHIRG